MFENTSQEDIIFYSILFYLILSVYGFYEIRKYVLKCKDYKIDAFDNSVLKAVFMCLVCGIFTTLVLILGTIQIIYEEFKKE
jgi:hypothetical protein